MGNAYKWWDICLVPDIKLTACGQVDVSYSESAIITLITVYNENVMCGRDPGIEQLLHYE